MQPVVVVGLFSFAGLVGGRRSGGEFLSDFGVSSEVLGLCFDSSRLAL